MLAFALRRILVALRGAQYMRAGLAQHLAAPPGMGEQGDEIAHRAADHDEAGFLAGALGRQRLQAADRRITLAPVVADPGSVALSGYS
jgi:hypothetical protein